MSLTVQDQVIPLTVNLDDPDGDCDSRYTPQPESWRLIEHGTCLSAGFGGQIRGLTANREQNERPTAAGRNIRYLIGLVG